MLKDCPKPGMQRLKLAIIIVRYLNHTEIVSTNTQDFQMSLITNLKTKEYGNEQTTKY